MTCTCKVFSTLTLDSRYFYSGGKERSISFSRLMLRDSCLYSSLACSVYSICWIYSYFLLSCFKSHADIYSTHNSVICSAENMFVHFFEFTRGGLIRTRWICGRIYWFQGKDFNEKSYIVFSGGESPSCAKSLNVTWYFVEVRALCR